MTISCEKKTVEVGGEVVELLNKSADTTISRESRREFLDNSVAILQNRSNDLRKRELLFRVAGYYFDLNYKDDYLSASRLALKASETANDSISIAKSLYFIGDYHEAVIHLDSAFFYYNQAQKVYERLENVEESGRMILYKAGILYDAGNYSEGEIQGIKALRLLSKTKNTRLIYESYIVIALCLKEMNNFPMALKYFDLATDQLDQLEKENFPKNSIASSRAACSNNIANIYVKTGEFQSAIQLYQKALSVQNLQTDRPKLYATLLSNLAYAKMKSGNFNNVEEDFNKAAEISKNLKILPGIVAGNIKMGEYYLIKKDTAKAISLVSEAYHIARKIKSSPEVLQALKLLIENDPVNKKYYSDIYFKVNDSMQNAERLTRNKFARIAYETQQVVEKNEVLSRRNKFIFWISILIIVIALGIFTLLRLKLKNRKLVYAQAQQESNAKIYSLMLAQQTQTLEARKEERDRIAMELHDGILNNLFTTRFNLSAMDSYSVDKRNAIVAELQKTETEIRRLSHDLQNNLLFDDKSLPGILSDLVASQHNGSGTIFDLSVDKYIDWTTVSEENKIHIYRIVQEAIQNVHKYANAERCLVIILKMDSKIIIRIWDNGSGFNVKSARNGIGLKNIAERAKLLNGELKITSDTNAGTTIEISF